MSWEALSAIATAVAAMGAWYYAMLTRSLWVEAKKQATETAHQRETELMLRLIDGYDSLRGDMATLQEWIRESRDARVDPFERFKEAAAVDFRIDNSGDVDDARFRASRFFVRVRKLVQAGQLSEQVVINALDRDAVKRFLDTIDPLDEVKAGKRYRPIDRDFFTALKERYPNPKRT